MTTRIIQYCCICIVLIGGVLTIIGPAGVHAGERSATSADECRAMLRALYAAVPPLAGDQAWFMRYTVTVTNRDDGSVHTSRSEMLMSLKKMYLVSDEMEIYQDEQTSVAVLPPEKKIYIADRNGREDTQQWMQMFTALRDTLVFSYSTVRDCRTIRTHDGAMLQQITLGLTHEARKRSGGRFPIESIVITFDPKTNRLHTYTTVFAAPYALASMAISFQEINYRYSTDKLSTHAGGKYLTAGRKLRPAYNSYTVIDMRAKR